MLSPSRVLALGAHPDDIEYGCLGFLLKLGNNVEKHFYIASMGSVGDPTSTPRRIEESISALSVTKPKHIYRRMEAGIPRAAFESTVEDVYKIIDEVRPDLILTHGPHDTHQEHRELYEITIAAARRSRATILSYGILSNTLDFSPSLFVDISDVYQIKKGALKEHKTQAQKFYMQDQHLDIFHAHNYASLHGIRFCEAFEVVRMFL